MVSRLPALSGAACSVVLGLMPALASGVPEGPLVKLCRPNGTVIWVPFPIEPDDNTPSDPYAAACHAPCLHERRSGKEQLKEAKRTEG